MENSIIRLRKPQTIRDAEVYPRTDRVNKLRLLVCNETYSIGDKQPIVSVECNYTEYKTRYSIGRIHKISLFVWRWLILCRKDGKVKVYEVLSTRYYIASVVELATRGQARLRNWFESNPCLSPSFYKERFPLSYKV